MKIYDFYDVVSDIIHIQRKRADIPLMPALKARHAGAPFAKRKMMLARHNKCLQEKQNRYNLALKCHKIR